MAAQGLNKTKRRIKSVKNTRKITKAMELIATSKLKRFKTIMLEGDLYASKIKDVIARLNSLTEKEKENGNKLIKNKLFIIVNSNLGLCGGYNSDIYKYVANLNIGENDTILPIGSRALSRYKDYKNSVTSYASINEHLEIEDINNLAAFLLKEYNESKYGEIILVYTQYINSITFKACHITLLPVQTDAEVDKDDVKFSPIIEPSIDVLLKEITPIYVSSLLYQHLIEAQVSEQASRRTAMDNATDNADELLDKLTIVYNKARQSAITQEITEVVSGANNSR